MGRRLGPGYLTFRVETASGRSTASAKVLRRPAVGRALIHERSTTASTNDDAKQLALAGAAHGDAVLSRVQTAGRGRAGRSFASPEGGLYLSVVLRPRAPPASWGLLPLAVGARVAATLRRAGFPVALKWPNDLLVGSQKLGGILVESSLGERPFAVVGLGLNVEGAPVEGATSLRAHGEPPAWRALAEALRAAIAGASDALDRDGGRDLLPEIRAHCVTLGKKVAWEKGEGVAVDVDDDGALLVETAGGARERVVAGDVQIRQAL